jgi:3-oxoacyl-[acyl-carrier protein] reductase
MGIPTRSVPIQPCAAEVAVPAGATGHACLIASDATIRDALRQGLGVLGMRVTEIEATLPDRAAFDAAFTSAVRIEPPTLVVIALLPEAASTSCTVEKMKDDHWHAACRAIIRSTLHCLQAAQAHATSSGMSIVVLGPAFGFSGSADLVPLSTAIEAQRGLVKAAARQLGGAGITINWVGINSLLLSPRLAAARLPYRDERIPVALGQAPTLEADVTPLMAFLAGPAGRKITGASLCMDGGEWMLP